MKTVLYPALALSLLSAGALLRAPTAGACGRAARASPVLAQSALGAGHTVGGCNVSDRSVTLAELLAAQALRSTVTGQSRPMSSPATRSEDAAPVPPPAPREEKKEESEPAPERKPTREPSRAPDVRPDTTLTTGGLPLRGMSSAQQMMAVVQSAARPNRGCH